MDEILISVAECSKRISVSRALLYSWFANRKSPYCRIFIKISRRLMVDPKQLAELLESLRTEQAEPKDRTFVVIEGGPKDHAQTR